VTERRALPWLNRNVAGMGATSFLSDASHEAATTVLPSFLAALGLPPIALGLIEGISDAASSFVKLGSGWLGDRTGRRWAIAVFGYALTGLMPLLLAAAGSWLVVLAAKTLGWAGRGIRGPVRDAILAESVELAARGRAFGFHRALDTVGAVVGPAFAVVLLGALAGVVAEPVAGFRAVFLAALAPGLLALLTFAFFVRDPDRRPRPVGGLFSALGTLPGEFRAFLVGVGLFGAGDFAPTMLILAATTLMTPSLGIVAAGSVAGLLYLVRNAVYALASYPVGAASDRSGRPIGLLAAGYLLGAAVALGTCLAFVVGTDDPLLLATLFVGSGILAAVQDTLEAVATARLAEARSRSTAFGALGAVNGLGDLIASAGVGLLWTVATPVLAFGAAAAVMASGAALVAGLARDERHGER